jgi:hypothetical protein
MDDRRNDWSGPPQEKGIVTVGRMGGCYDITVLDGIRTEDHSGMPLSTEMSTEAVQCMHLDITDLVLTLWGSIVTCPFEIGKIELLFAVRPPERTVLFVSFHH